MTQCQQEASLENCPSYVLHPIRGIVWAAFWGTPVAAGIIMAINYWRIGNKSASRIAVILGAVGTVGLFGLTFAIPSELQDAVPSAGFIVPQILLVGFFAKYFQRGFIQEHASNGGSVASAWPSVGIGLLCLMIILVGLFGAIYFHHLSYGTSIKFGKDEVYYAGQANEQDARKLAEVLQELRFFRNAGISARISATSSQYSISFVIVKNALREAKTTDVFRTLGETVAANGFPTLTEVRLCNEYFSTKVVIPIE